MIRKLDCGEYEFQYILYRKKVKNINFRVKEDGIIYVSASKNISLDVIERFIRENADKFNDMQVKIRKKSQFEIHPAEMHDGTTFRYLGRDITIKIGDINGQFGLLGDELHIPKENALETEKYIREWISERCKELFSELNAEVYKRFAECGYDLPKFVVTIKNMKSRWGSCNPISRKISMNIRLMHYPQECAYAVFCHEYTHYYVANHSSDFYALLLKICPEYRKYDKMLK